MAKFFVSDQQHVSFRYESGTYAVPSGVNTWIGLVTDHSVDEDMGVIPVRYAGTNSRLTQQFLDGPQTFTNSITFHPQNFRMLKFVLGSCVDGGSPSPYTHNYLPNHNNPNSPHARLHAHADQRSRADGQARELAALQRHRLGHGRGHGRLDARADRPAGIMTTPHGSPQDSRVATRQ